MIHNGYIQLPDFGYTDTGLRIGDIHFPRWTGHGLEQSLEEESAGTLVRAADGGLLFLGVFPEGDERNIRLTTRISSTDRFIAPLGFIKPGIAYEVECVTELPAGRGGIVQASDFERLHVPGSIVYRDAQMRAIASDGEGRLTSLLDATRVAWTYYRPVLLMKMTSKSVGSYNPWAGSASWSIEMREHQLLAKG